MLHEIRREATLPCALLALPRQPAPLRLDGTDLELALMNDNQEICER